MLKTCRVYVYIVVAAFFLVGMTLSGCCAILGIATLAPQSGEGYHSKVFDKDPAYCYDNTLGALKKWEATAFQTSKNKYIVAMNLGGIYPNTIDTTELDIFFKDMGGGKTEVGVSALNYHLSSFVADNLFAYLENPDAPTLKPVPVKVDRSWEERRGAY